MTVKFSEIRPKALLSEAPSMIDPPTVLVLRRTAIRLFPGGDRVAKYKNDNYDIEIAIPYNPKTLGKALISTSVTEGKLHKYKVTDTKHGVYDHVHAKDENDAYTKFISKNGEFSHPSHAKIEKVTESTADNLLGSYITHAQGAAQHDKHFKPLAAIKRIVAKRYGQQAVKHFTAAGDKYAAGEHGANRHYAKFKSVVDATGADKPIHEAAIHQIHTITKTKAPADVSFKSGGSARVSPQQAAVIMRLHTVMKPENKAKIEALVNSGPDGLAKVAEFASNNLQ